MITDRPLVGSNALRRYSLMYSRDSRQEDESKNILSSPLNYVVAIPLSGPCFLDTVFEHEVNPVTLEIYQDALANSFRQKNNLDISDYVSEEDRVVYEQIPNDRMILVSRLIDDHQHFDRLKVQLSDEYRRRLVEMMKSHDWILFAICRKPCIVFDYYTKDGPSSALFDACKVYDNEGVTMTYDQIYEVRGVDRDVAIDAESRIINFIETRLHGDGDRAEYQPYDGTTTRLYRKDGEHWSGYMRHGDLVKFRLCGKIYTAE